jgi:ATP-binding cassette subfamily F protein uup
MAWIQLKGVTVAFGGPPVLDGADLHLERGERLCLLGRNGAGKSTLLKALQGTIELDDGEILRPPGLRVASLPQEVPASLAGTVFDAVAEGAAGTADLDRAVRTSISRVGLEPSDAVAPLSAGLKRRVLLARALASDPDLLLLDEPTNHLDVDSIAWLEEFLRRQGRTLLFVTHDRAFLRRLATGILDLDRGRLTRWEADYDTYRDRREEELATEARQDALFDKKLAQEEVWIRRGVRERRKRNQGRVRRLEDMRSTRGVRRELPGAVKIEAQAAAASGRLVVETKHLDFSWGDEPFVKDLSTTIMRGDRIGIVGPNGSGKTTLLQLLLGELQPAKGTVRLGVNLEIAYFDQLHNVLDDDASAADNVNHGRPTVEVNGKTRQVVSYLRDFLFTADQARGPIGAFSGGERARLALARLFARPSNVLVLDEPTNDLDLETLELLEDLLVDYPGTILLVSHDRELLDDVVTSTFVVEGRGVIHEYVGGYSDALRQRVAVETPKPKRERPAKAPRRRSALDRTERQELRDLPGTIERLEEEQASLHADMADPAFFKREGEVIAEAKERLVRIEQELEVAYGRWEELEAKA